MANTLRFKRGLVSGIPTAALGEPLFTTDTFDLYIGNGTGNTRFQKYIASGTTSQLLRGDGSLLTMPIVLTSPSNGQVLKYNGTNWVNDSDAGITGSGSAGQVAYFTGATTQGGSNNLFWDATNSRLGIGTNVPSDALQVRVSGVNDIVRFNTISGGGGFIVLGDGNTSVSPKIGANGNRLVFLTNSTGSATERMRLMENGNLLLGSTTDNGLRFQVTGDGYFSGSVGIGSTSLTNRALSIIKTMTGSTDGYGILQFNTVSSGVTANAINNYSQFATQATAFTLTNAYHYYHADISVGAGSTITNQYGYFVPAIQTATNNYGFYGNIVAGTGRWNLYMNGTAANYLAGNTGIGVTPSFPLHVSGVGYITGNVNIGSSSQQKVTQFGGGATGLTITSATYPILSLWDTGDTNWNFMLGMNDGLAYIWNQANSAITFSTNATERMRLDASGNLGLGTTSPTSYSGFTTLSINNATNGAVLDLLTNNVRIGSIYTGLLGASVNLYATANVPLIFGTNNTEIARFFANGNFRVGAVAADAGFRLDVNGTMRVSGASTFGGRMTLDQSVNLPVYIEIKNTTSGNNAGAYLVATSTNGVIEVGKYSATNSTYKILSANTGFIRNSTAGDLSILNDWASGEIKMAAGGSFTPHFTIASTGAATFSSTVTGGSFIPTSATAPTNGMYLAATNTLAFSTSSVERMRIDSAGNIAIGVTTAAGRLHAQQSIATVNTTNLGNNSAVGLNITAPDTALAGGEGIAIALGMNGRGRSYIANIHSSTSKDACETAFFNTSGAVINERMRIKYEGQVRFVPLASAPTVVQAGDVYYDSTTNKLRCYNGTTWNDLF